MDKRSDKWWCMPHWFSLKVAWLPRRPTFSRARFTQPFSQIKKENEVNDIQGHNQQLWTQLSSEQLHQRRDHWDVGGARVAAPPRHRADLLRGQRRPGRQGGVKEKRFKYLPPKSTWWVHAEIPGRKDRMKARKRMTDPDPHDEINLSEVAAGAH